MKYIALVFGLILLQKINAQQVLWHADGEETGQGSLSQMEWLAGYWVGPGLGGHCEEVWLPATDNSMIGAFRYLREGKIVFTEYLVIEEHNQTLTLRVKHFSRDLSAWEEKEQWANFKLIRIEGQTAWFNGLVLHHEGDSLTISLAIRSKEGMRTETFNYARQKL
jgi:hypothetical protein